jgi:putative transposase
VLFRSHYPIMPRPNRCVLPDVPCHITQRGVDRRETFSSDTDRLTYLRLLRDNLPDARATILGFCLMTNHVHLIAVPERQDSLAVLLRRVHGRYAQYYNTRSARTGHLWQNRFFACVLDESHLWTALAYVDRNPLRAGMVERGGDYRWSSAAAHLWGDDATGVLDMTWWRRETCGVDWETTRRADHADADSALRRCTYAGRPFGDPSFVKEMSEKFGRCWTRGRPKKQAGAAGPAASGRQIALFAIRKTAFFQADPFFRSLTRFFVRFTMRSSAWTTGQPTASSWPMRLKGCNERGVTE